MITVKDFTHAQKLLEHFIPATKSVRYTLGRMQALMTFLGNPQDHLKVIHVAGTSGKTSTAYFAAALLVENGLKVGLSVSPHIDSVAERAQINLQTLTEDIYCQELGIFLNLVDRSNLHPTYFEVLVAFSFWLFDRQKVEYAVIEVGLGGLLDGTNVIHRKDKICVITDIGYDHTEILGNTLEQISVQKAGIIHENNQVFMHTQATEIMRAVRQKAQQENARLEEVKEDEMLTRHGEFKALPKFQQRNFSLAYAAVKDIIPQRRNISKALCVYIPARMEEVIWQNKTIILDGSHNEQKIASLVEAVEKKYTNQSILLVVSFGENKSTSLTGSLDILRSISSHVVITKFNLGQDEIRKPIDPIVIDALAKELGFMTKIHNDPKEAFLYALKQKEQVILVTGSFYLLNHIRPIMKPGGQIR